MLLECSLNFKTHILRLKRNDYKSTPAAIVMARKKTRKMQKHENKVALFWTGASGTSGTFSDSVYIDTAQCASIINRKLYRQGNMFRIKNLRAYSQDNAPAEVDIRISVIPRVWPFFNGYRKARAMWHKMNASMTDGLSPSVYPKYHDFKVFMNEAHYTNHLGGGDTNLLPVDGDNVAVPAGEWVYSQFSDAGSTSDNYYGHVLGDHGGSSSNWTSVGLIEAYAQSRAKPKSDATATDGETPTNILTSPWSRLMDDSDQSADVVTNLLADNDNPPYDRSNYAGGAGSFEGGLNVLKTRLQHNAIGSATGTGLVSAPTFDAPLGLIRIELDAEQSMDISDLHISFEWEIIGEL